MLDVRDELRRQCAQMLNADMQVPPDTRAQLKCMGFAEDEISMKALIIANIGKLALGKNARNAVEAARMLFEICGDNAREREESMRLQVPEIFKRYYPRYKAGEIGWNDLAILCGLTRRQLVKIIEITERDAIDD